MKHFLPYVTLIVTSLLLSCDKIDSDLTGKWQLNETYFLITPNQDFTFYNLFDKPWKGEIKINDTTLDVSSFSYYYDNSRPGNLLASNGACFTFMESKLLVEYVGEMYVLDINIFDVQSGIFKAEGTATGIFQTEGQSLQVKIDLSMPKMEMKQGEQVRVKDGYHNIPYHKLRLHPNGKMDTNFLMGDIMEQISGRWSVKSSHVTFFPDKGNESVYRYSINGNQLILSRELDSDIATLSSNLSPYRGKLEKIIFCADYTRE